MAKITTRVQRNDCDACGANTGIDREHEQRGDDTEARQLAHHPDAAHVARAAA